MINFDLFKNLFFKLAYMVIDFINFTIETYENNKMIFLFIFSIIIVFVLFFLLIKITKRVKKAKRDNTNAIVEFDNIDNNINDNGFFKNIMKLPMRIREVKKLEKVREDLKQIKNQKEMPLDLILYMIRNEKDVSFVGKDGKVFVEKLTPDHLQKIREKKQNIINNINTISKDINKQTSNKIKELLPDADIKVDIWGNISSIMLKEDIKTEKKNQIENKIKREIENSDFLEKMINYDLEEENTETVKNTEQDTPKNIKELKQQRKKINDTEQVDYEVSQKILDFLNSNGNVSNDQDKKTKQKHNQSKKIDNDNHDLINFVKEFFSDSNLKEDCFIKLENGFSISDESLCIIFNSEKKKSNQKLLLKLKSKDFKEEKDFIIINDSIVFLADLNELFK